MPEKLRIIDVIFIDYKKLFIMLLYNRLTGMRWVYCIITL